MGTDADLGALPDPTKKYRETLTPAEEFVFTQLLVPDTKMVSTEELHARSGAGPFCYFAVGSLSGGNGQIPEVDIELRIIAGDPSSLHGEWAFIGQHSIPWFVPCSVVIAVRKFVEEKIRALFGLADGVPGGVREATVRSRMHSGLLSETQLRRFREEGIPV
jgi:hypothetical protein